MIVTRTATSDRLDRVIGDINGLLHAGSSPDAKARAQRWCALTLAKVAHGRHWRFLDRLVHLDLPPGADVVELVGDFDKVVRVYAPKRLFSTSLARITDARLNAQADGTPNGGLPTDYAIEANRKLHLWPAPVGAAVTATADAAADTLTLSGAALAAGKPVRLSSSAQLPTPLVSGTTYYALPVSAGVIRLASNLDGVLTGTAIDLTSAGSGTLTLTPLTRLSLLYTVPMDMALVPDHFEPMVLDGALGMYGRHFDRDTLTEDAPDFEVRYVRQLARAGVLDHDFERAYPHEQLTAAETYGRAPDSALGNAQSYVLPASISGIGYVTIEVGDNPLVVS